MLPLQVPVWHYPIADERPKFGQLVIPTLDSVRYEHLLTLVHSVGKARAPGSHHLTDANAAACCCCAANTHMFDRKSRSASPH